MSESDHVLSSVRPQHDDSVTARRDGLLLSPPRGSAGRSHRGCRSEQSIAGKTYVKLNNARPEFDEVDRKVMVNAAVNPDAVRPTIRRRASAPALRWVLEQCLRQRRVGVCVIDEAQHLKRLASGRRVLDQIRTLRIPAGIAHSMDSE